MKCPQCKRDIPVSPADWDRYEPKLCNECEELVNALNAEKKLEKYYERVQASNNRVG